MTASAAEATRAPALPRFPVNDAAAQGRLAALRLLHDTLTSRDTSDAYEHRIDAVLDGPAPQPFKDGFATTLDALTTALHGN